MTDTDMKKRLLNTAKITQGAASRRLLSLYLMLNYDPEVGYVDMSRGAAEILGIGSTTFTVAVRSLTDQGLWRVEHRPAAANRFYPLFLDEVSSV